MERNEKKLDLHGEKAKDIGLTYRKAKRDWIYVEGSQKELDLREKKAKEIGFTWRENNKKKLLIKHKQYKMRIKWVHKKKIKS